MAVTISLYNNTVKRLLNKEVTYTTLKLMLLNNTASFTAANTTLSQVSNAGAYEVSGNGWAAGGQTLANVAVTVVTINDAKLDADDVIVTATGGAIGPAYKAVLYDDTDASDAPLAFIDFGQVEEAGQDTDFRVVWNASGILTLTYA